MKRILIISLCTSWSCLAGDKPSSLGFSELPDSASKLIDTLKSSGAGLTVLKTRLDYVKESDLPHLIELLDSKEPCGHVALAISSIYYPGKSTVGHEAAYLIEGFWKRYYPTQLTSQQYKPDVEGIKRWYGMWSHLKKLVEQGGPANGSQREAPARMLRVRTNYRIADDCILVLHSYATNTLSLTVTAIKETSKRTNTCRVDLDPGVTKELDLLQGWILVPDDRARVEIVSSNYDISRIWVNGCRTPSRKVVEQQEEIFKGFRQTKDPVEKDRNAQTLSDIWGAGLLSDEIRDQLVQDYFQLVLRQISPSYGVPSWIVHSSQNFPFPDIYTAFTPILYSNDQVKWSPGDPQSSCAMTATNNPIASMSGGVFKNGDILQCRVELRQTVNGRAWRKTLWSNKIVLQGLKD